MMHSSSRRHRPEHGRRAGFTMVEIVVVVGIIMTLSAMVFLLGTGIRDRDRPTQAASDLQGWFKMAQVWALRDQRIYGVRLLNAAAGRVNQVMFVYQPADYVPPNSQITLTPGQATVTGNMALPAPEPTGDFLEVYSGANAKIFHIKSASGNTLNIYPAWSGTAGSTTTDFRIIRQPQPKDGEPIFQLPQGVIIDVSTNNVYSSPLPAQSGNPAYLDILFGPDGRVVSPGTQGGNLLFWVRDTNDDTGNALTDRFQHNPLLVVVGVRTGMIAVHPVNVNDPNNPYLFTQDGRSSGF